MGQCNSSKAIPKPTTTDALSVDDLYELLRNCQTHAEISSIMTDYLFIPLIASRNMRKVSQNSNIIIAVIEGENVSIDWYAKDEVGKIIDPAAPKTLTGRKLREIIYVIYAMTCNDENMAITLNAICDDEEFILADLNKMFNNIPLS